MALSKLLAVIALLSLQSSFCVGETELVLALEDTFEDFDLSFWRHELTLGGGGSNEFQWYTNNRSNSYVENGVLHINPTLTEDDIGLEAVQQGSANIWGFEPASLCTGNANFGCERSVALPHYNYINPIKSARIRTAETFSFTYGKVEIRAKLPRGDWLWPGITMMPTDNNYGDWPRSGSIEIMSSRGNPPSYTHGGYDKWGSALHWGVDTMSRWPLTNQGTSANQLQDFTADFHTYGLIWNETYIGTYLDDESNPVLQVPIDQSFFQRGGWDPSVSNLWRNRGDNAPFDRRFYLVIFLAAGSTDGYFPDGEMSNKPWSDSSPNAVNQFYNVIHEWLPTWTQSFQIDSVRVWTNRDVNSNENLLLQSLKDRCGCMKNLNSCL